MAPDCLGDHEVRGAITRWEYQNAGATMNK